MRPGGTILTQDGPLRAIARLIGDDAFWSETVGVRPTRIVGLGTRKLVEIEFGEPERSA